LRCKAARGGILDQGLLQGSKVSRKINIRTGVEHGAGKAVIEQAAERIAKSEIRSQAQATEKATAGPPQPDQVIAAVRARPKNRVCDAQFSKCQPEHGGGKLRRIRTDNPHPRVVPEKPGESTIEPLREVTALLPPPLESGRDHFLWQRAACGKQVTSHIALEPGDFGERVRHKRPVELRRPVGSEQRYQSCLGLTGNDGACKNGHGLSRVSCFWLVSAALRPRCIERRGGRPLIAPAWKRSASRPRPARTFFLVCRRRFASGMG
jgi:hypothetical protein